MYKVVNIGGKDVELAATASTAIRMKQVFGIDLISIFAHAEENGGAEISSVMSQLAYIMNCQALKKDMSKLNMDTFFEWCDEFGGADILMCADEIISVYMGNAETSSESKKNSN